MIDRCAVCGKPWSAHLGVEGTCRLHYRCRGAIVKALAVLRAVNDHRDEAPCLDRVIEEYTHVGAVVIRTLGRLLGGRVEG